MTVLWPLALITLKEGLRNRSIYGITIFALLLLTANYLIAGMILRDVGKVAVDMALSAVSFCGLLLVLFVGINLIAKDLDKRTIYMVLSRPISRPQYIVGKFFGMVLLILSAVGFLGLFALLSIAMIKASYGSYFSGFSWSPVVIALFFSALMLILLAAVSFLFASFSSSSFITLVLTMITYIIGNSLSDVKNLIESPQVVGITVSPMTVKMVQTAYYIFPNLSLLDMKTRAAHGLAIEPLYLLWTVLYAAVYTGLAITLAALIFRKRELP